MITGVFVGGTGGLVEVGRGVLVGRGVDVRVVVECAMTVRGVNVGIKVGVREGVRVAVGVAVGIVDVIVGVSEAVAVGAVEVGKGPRSNPAVRARAVFVLFAFRCASASRGERQKAMTESSKIKPIPMRPTNRTCSGTRFSFQFTFAVLLSFTWHTQTAEMALVKSSIGF